MPRYNIAAVPVDVALHRDFFAAAASLGEVADSYQLAAGRALPHVTLCQFSAANDTEVLHLFPEKSMRSLNVLNTGIYIMKGHKKDTGKFWVGYTTRKDVALTTAQTEIVKLLQSENKEIFTEKEENYFPHFTLIRAASAAISLDEKLMFNERLVGASIRCHIRLGLSGEQGQFLRYMDEIS